MVPQKNCFERRDLSGIQSSFIMTLFRNGFRGKTEFSVAPGARTALLRLAGRLIAGILLLTFVGAAHADLASIFTNTAVRAAIPRRASIIFIQCHGLGFGDLSCYGQTNFQTPNLDQLAAKGMRFTHYTPGDTNPAALTLALLNGTSTPSGGLTVAQTLKNLGYHTGMIGEWPLSVEPWKLGFDDFAGFLNPDEGTNYYADSFWRYTPKMFYSPISHSWTDWQPGDGPNNGGRELIFQNSGGQKVRYLPDFMLAGWMQNFVRSHQPDRYNGFDPFFLLVNLPAPRTATPGKDDFPVPSDAPYTDEPWPQAAKNRAALLTHLDGDIAGLIEVLNQLGMTNDVAIFLTSGNVPEKFADPRLNFFRAAADLQNTPTNDWSAPMIVYWPGEVPAGQVSDYKWSARDFLPTAAQIGLCPAPENIEGQSILPLLLGRKMPDSP
jgi:arylsulfatase A